MRPIPGHSIPLVVTGTFVLAFGWFGFNAGSTLAGTDARTSVVAVNTMLASAAGAFASYVDVSRRFGKPDVTMLCNGMLAGLVAITASCAFVSPLAAVTIGAVAGVLVVWAAVFVENRLKIDDPVGAIAVHGMNGTWGILALGLFADGTYGEGLNGVAGPVRGLLYGDPSQLAAQCAGIVANVLYVGTVTTVAFRAIDWLVGNRVSEGPIRVTTIIDFLYARCVRPTEIATDAGLSIKGPPDPDFSLAGRTPQSLLRIVDAWHAELAVRRGTGRTWPASRLQGFRYAEPPRPEAEEGPTEWWIAELLSSGELVAEGRALRHCVASYEDRCVRGASSIWSLRRQAGEGAPARRFTIEVDPRARAIVQIRGFANRRADGQPRRIIGMWAERERLTVASYA